ncbi:hypothetical protein I4U23_003187 [Adineta vaga]|nr:hypothetical protein I4U23_003187 [Adineta vaga]
MDCNLAHILNIPDEILLNIFTKFTNIDVLYSLVGIHEKFDRIAYDSKFTEIIDLTALLPDGSYGSLEDDIINRFYTVLLPRIHNNVKSLTVQASSFLNIISMNSYPNLHMLTLHNLGYNVASHIFTENSPFVYCYKHQITHLVMTIKDDLRIRLMEVAMSQIYGAISMWFSKLQYISVDGHAHISYTRRILSGLSPSRCYFSGVVYLSIKIHDLDDCFCLLDGGLRQLEALCVQLDNLHFSRMTINDENSFIDGNYLTNDITCHMARLREFTFDIISDNTSINVYPKPSSDDIRRTFIDNGYHADCYIDYSDMNDTIGRCHIYSLPFTMKSIQRVTSKFPGGTFTNVRRLRILDFERSFENSFFVKISQSFPLLHLLSVSNTIERLEKPSHRAMKNKDTSSVIEFPNLMEIYLVDVHIDYVEQFLCCLNTRLPSLSTLHAHYEQLLTVTKNFTRNETRINCAKVKDVYLSEGMDLIGYADCDLFS